MDDILIFTTEDELEVERDRRVNMVLQRLKDKDLFLKLSKCEFKKRTIEYLGLLMGHNKLMMDPIKLASPLWPSTSGMGGWGEGVFVK